MFKRLVASCILVCFIMVITGCATIIHGKFQKLEVSTEPQGAIVTASDGRTTTTPGMLKIDRSKQTYTLNIKKEGYEDVNMTLKRGIDPWFWGNILIGGIIGIVVDMSTGAAYKFKPDKIDEVLAKKGIDTSKLDTKHTVYIFVDLIERHPDLDISELERIN